jgi:hypothetical protein
MGMLGTISDRKVPTTPHINDMQFFLNQFLSTPTQMHVIWDLPGAK